MSMHVGRAVAVFRVAAGHSQKSLARAVGYDPSYFCLIENDKRAPSLAALQQIADALKVPAHLIVAIASRDPRTRTDGLDQELGATIRSLLSRKVGRK
jgi:transcriptional regulator with XRE-family HTH domain